MLNIIIVSNNKNIVKEIEKKIIAVSQDISITVTESLRTGIDLIKTIKPKAIIIEFITLVQAGKILAESSIDNQCDIVIYHIGEFFQLVNGNKASSSNAGYCLTFYSFLNNFLSTN